MPEPTILAPNVGNYIVGKGKVSFKREGAASFVDLGNCPAFSIELSIDTLEHFSSRTGIKTKDYEIVLTRGGTAKITMEEWTAHNLALMLMGSVDETPSDGQPEIEIFSQDIIYGYLKFEATNDVGPQWNFDLFYVAFKPSGSINPISDEWGNLEAECEVLVAPEGNAHVGRVGKAKITNLTVSA